MESAVDLSPREIEPSLTELSESILCPILQTPMQDPVMAADGHSYERAAIEQWISQRGARAVSPLTGSRLAHLELTPNITLRVIIQTYLTSLPQRHIKNLSQQDLALAIKLREEELSNQLAKQHKQLEQLSSVQERLGPMAEENKRLKAEIESLRKNIKFNWDNNNNNINSNNHSSNNNSNNDSVRLILRDSDPVIKKYLSDIDLLSEQLSELNKYHAANMIKRLFTSRINRKKLNQTKLIQEEENVSHRIEILEQEYQKTQAELQRSLQVSLQEAESRLKSNLAEIGKKMAEHTNEDGDDEAIEKLATERRRLRESHVSHKAQLEAAHSVEQKREEQKQVLAVQEQKNRLQQIRASKASKKRELCRWADYTKHYTDVIEIQRQKRVELSSSRSSQIEQLARYSKEAEINASKLLISRREREARKARELAERQARERAERENAERQARLLAERQAAERETARLASLTPNSRVNEKAQSVSGRVRKEELTELSSFTIRGQLEEVRACLRRNSNLVHAQYDLTDLSERTFPKITGFQYAVWCGDEELWNIFLEFMTEAEACDQLMALLKERPDITNKHGAPLSFFDPLLTAYQRYEENYNREDWEQCEFCWNREVGGTQRNMPAWFIYMFSEEGKDKAWPTQQMTTRFTRKTDHVSRWFEQVYDNGKCGSTFAFLRLAAVCVSVWVGSRRLCGCEFEDVCLCLPPPGARGGFFADSENSASLKTECTKKLAVLTERLSQAAKSETSISSPFGLRK